MRNVVAVQHIGCETPGKFEDALQATGIGIRHVRVFDNDAVPAEMGDAAGLLVMGGPMSVYQKDRYPFLAEEIRLIQDAIRQEKPLLGVCLGSQLLAAALGARVMKGKQKEIGWHTVNLTDEATGDPLWEGVQNSFTAFHWHGDIFDLPEGAVPLAASALTECQAFRYGQNAYGILCHMEVTREIISCMIDAFGEELREENIKGEALLRQAETHLPPLHRVGGTLFRHWVELII
ncbi:MAG: gamma-glutamyl-gamma-aminobutyrate hydrolase family protein [Bacteroidota bacterium]